MPKRQMVLDVDVGIDDAVMMMAIAAEPEAEIVAVGSAHGNCTAATAAQNALKVLETIGLDHIPVAQGAESPLDPPHSAPQVHGHDGLADVGLPAPRGTVTGESAVDQILRLSLERPGELDLIAVATMTNLALALERDPTVLSRFRTVAILGAFARQPQPGDPIAFDANIAGSPQAAEALFTAHAPLVVVPIDTTRYSVLTPEHIDRIRHSTTPQGQLAWQILPHYFNFYQHRLDGVWSARMHDPLVPAVLLDPSLVTSSERKPFYVEPWEGAWRAVGRSGVELSGREPRPVAGVITSVNQPRFLDRFVDALTQPLGTLHPIAHA